MQAVADDVADVWTADVAADLIRLNYGEQDPSPSSPSGTSGESTVTAATLQDPPRVRCLSRVAGLRHVREQWTARADPPQPRAVPARPHPGDTRPVPGAVQDATGTGRCGVWPLSPPMTAVGRVPSTRSVTIDERWRTAVETARSGVGDVTRLRQDAI